MSNPMMDPCNMTGWDKRKKKAKVYDDDYDEMTVAELDETIDGWDLDISKSLNKAEKIAALRASDAEE